MKSQRLITLGLLTLLAVTPVVVNAQATTFPPVATFPPPPTPTLTVSILPQGGTVTTLAAESTGVVNLDLNSTGAARLFEPFFTITKCSGTGCTGGRARVFVTDSSIDNVVLTDAVIRNTSNTPGDARTIRVFINTGRYTQLVQSGIYPYAIELNGQFIAGPLQPTGTAPNRIEIRAWACNAFTTGINEDGTPIFGGDCQQIDNPGDDFTTSEGENFSISAPPHKPVGTLQFSPKEMQDLQCGFGEGEGDDGTCDSYLLVDALITLRPGASARLPGSIGVHHVNTLSAEGGSEIMADLFASLGPKGAELYEARLEPSPGADQRLQFRSGPESSIYPWVSRRGEGVSGSSDGVGASVSATKAKLLNNGTGQVTAKGLCPADGCLSTSAAVLPVQVYCGGEVASITVLRLSSKGDGTADLAFSLPCNDPAVLIMDPSGDSWVAAPVVF